MKKHFCLALAGALISATSFAQLSLSDFSVGAAGNYTMYKGDFQQSTPGFKLELNYGVYEKVGFTLGFTKGIAIKTPSAITINNGTESKTVESNVNYRFSTISLATRYRFLGNDESAFHAYFPLGLSYVMVKYDEKAKQDIPAGYNAMDQLEPGSESGFMMNGGLGVQYQLGRPVIFGEGMVGVPANTMNNAYIENPMPLHFIFNLGVRIPLGSRE